jgi:ribonuclease BN (tRNA processing enzyme)
MRLTILGSGTSVPHAARCGPAHWLGTSGGSILLDFSADAPHRMAQEQLDWPNLDAVWISHFHLDHLGGLPAFLFGVRWAPQVANRSKALKIFGGAGLLASDTGFSEDLVSFARDTDLLLMECSFRRNKPVESHLELKEAMLLAQLCNPGKLVLTHLYPEWDGVDLAAEAQNLWAGNTIEACDGLTIEI